MRIFKQFDVPVSIFEVARALESNPEAASVLIANGPEIVSHGWRRMEIRNVSEVNECEQIDLALQAIQRIGSFGPIGSMTRGPDTNTRRPLVENGQVLCDRDSLGDDQGLTGVAHPRSSTG